MSTPEEPQPTGESALATEDGAGALAPAAPTAAPALDADEPAAEVSTTERAKKKKKKKKPKPKSTLPDRDIQTWFRLTSRNLYTRRRQLDAKANILLSINAVMLTLTAGTVYPAIDGQIPLLIAMLPVSLANLAAIFLAVRAMRPHIPVRGGTFSEEEVADGTARLTTFDDYYRMPEASYVQAVGSVLQDQQFIHSSLTKDIYHVGILLAHRYRLLEIAYRIFIFGVLLSAVFFVIAEVTLRVWGIE